MAPVGEVFRCLAPLRSKLEATISTANGSDMLERQSPKPFEVQGTFTDYFLRPDAHSHNTETRISTSVVNQIRISQDFAKASDFRCH